MHDGREWGMNAWRPCLNGHPELPAGASCGRPRLACRNSSNGHSERPIWPAVSTKPRRQGLKFARPNSKAATSGVREVPSASGSRLEPLLRAGQKRAVDLDACRHFPNRLRGLCDQIRIRVGRPLASTGVPSSSYTVSVVCRPWRFRTFELSLHRHDRAPRSSSNRFDLAVPSWLWPALGSPVARRGWTSAMSRLSRWPAGSLPPPQAR